MNIATLLAVARQRALLALDAAAQARIEASHALLLALVARGDTVYGVTTGLGAAVDTRIDLPDPATQAQIPLARAVGVGREARPDEVRAIIAARLSRLATGRSGLSWPVASALQDLLNAGIEPVVPLTGSIGEGDLAPLAAVALALLGQGEVTVAGQRQPAAQALAAAGLRVPALAGKDGLALLSSNAASVGLGALAVADAGRVLHAVEAAAALSFEAWRANLSPLDAWASRSRPAPCQDTAARSLLQWLQGSDLFAPGAARQLQDPLSLRTAAPLFGAVRHAWTQARDAIELELDSSDDNPAVIVETQSVLPTANFDATHLALAVEHLGLALARLAAAAGERMMRLMSASASGLPRFLAAQPGQTGFATLQKTISALVADIVHLAQPQAAVTLAVADRVEDYASQAMRAVTKLGELVAALRALAAIELMVAAQAVDLRAASQPLALGTRTAALHACIRERVGFRDVDRPASADILALAGWIADDGVARLAPGELVGPA